MFKISIYSLISINLLIIFFSYNLFIHDKFIIHDKLNFEDRYEEKLAQNIKSLSDLKKYIIEYSSENNIKKNNFEFIELCSDVIKDRFYYDGYSYYNIEENVFLYFLGKYIWRDFAAIVIPDHILKKDYAACSQQSIILMELLKSNNYQVRKVILNRHFALEVKFNNKWYFFDPTFEPTFHKRGSLKILVKNKKELYRSYKHTMNKKAVNWLFSKIKYGEENEFPAKKMKFFHQIVFFYEKYLVFITVFLFFVYFWIKNKRWNTKLNPKEK